MKNLITIDPIAVKDKQDVVRALTILEKVGIHRMTDEQKKDYLVDEKRTVDNCFMIQEDDGGFRIQSHYLGFGIPVEDLEKQVDEILVKHPDLGERIGDIEKREKELTKEIKEMKLRLTEEINGKEQEFNNSKKSIPVVRLKEERYPKKQ